MKEMVGSGAAGGGGGGGGGGDHARSKEAAGMMALHEALRNVCLNSDWTYSVFWTIRPRPYVYHLINYHPSYEFLPQTLISSLFPIYMSSKAVPRRQRVQGRRRQRQPVSEQLSIYTHAPPTNRSIVCVVINLGIYHICMQDADVGGRVLPAAGGGVPGGHRRRGPRPQGLQQDVHPALQLRRRVGAG